MTDLSEPLFAIAISDQPGTCRGLMRVGAGKFAIVNFREALLSSGASSVVNLESTFNVADAYRTAQNSFSNAPGIQKIHGKQLSAAFLMLCSELGLVPVGDGPPRGLIQHIQELIDAVEFDVNGVDGRGGHGGLTSNKTLKAAGALRQIICKLEGLVSEDAKTEDS
ncbi:hypothetical protein [Hoeflea sp.]|uniref:hypothetical protein n=1 Tax=Hoeflea sp. TaxID=1940281 RepID=UPI003B517E98